MTATLTFTYRLGWSKCTAAGTRSASSTPGSALRAFCCVIDLVSEHIGDIDDVHDIGPITIVGDERAINEQYGRGSWSEVEPDAHVVRARTKNRRPQRGSAENGDRWGTVAGPEEARPLNRIGGTRKTDHMIWSQSLTSICHLAIWCSPAIRKLGRATEQTPKLTGAKNGIYKKDRGSPRSYFAPVAHKRKETGRRRWDDRSGGCYTFTSTWRPSRWCVDEMNLAVLQRGAGGAGGVGGFGGVQHCVQYIYRIFCRRC